MRGDHRVATRPPVVVAVVVPLPLPLLLVVVMVVVAMEQSINLDASARRATATNRLLPTSVDAAMVTPRAARHRSLAAGPISPCRGGRLERSAVRPSE